MPAQALSQLNVRLDGGLKTAGDAVLAEAGTNSTQLIRALWRKVARGVEDLHQVEEILGLRTKDENASESTERRLAAMRHGRALFAEGLDELGINATSVLPTSEESDRDLYADALIERMQERGIW